MSAASDAQAQTSKPQRLRRTQAAAYLGAKRATLDRWAARNKGPRFIRISSRLVVYEVADLDAFLASCPTGGDPSCRMAIPDWRPREEALTEER